MHRNTAFGIVAFLLLYFCATVEAQTIMKGTVVDSETKEPLPGAIIRIGTGKSQTSTTDANGSFTINAKQGTAATISYIGYGVLPIILQQGKVYIMHPQVKSLNDIVVTATESKSLTSASNIGRHAMEHLQPSSFTDILELLPGGMARDPSLSSPNTIRIREVPVSSSDYATSSLGTSFVVDGAPISTNANMQYLAGASDNQSTSRDFTNEGVDMRSISTDDIQNVEIVRGIPSVEYGDLTSGLVKINRRRGGNDISVRFKADMDTKLFYLAKGMEWKKRQLSLNLSADYLDNRADPRNILETYSRVTFSARLFKKWTMENTTSDLGVNADYGGSFDRDKVDPEINYGGVDKYKSSYNRFAASVSYNIRNNRPGHVFRSFSAMLSVSTESDNTERTRLVQLSRETAAATSTVTGESDAVLIYPYKYTATQSVDGRPTTVYAKASAEFALPFLNRVSSTLKTGTDWQMDKNYGDGQVFDPLHPLYPEVSARPRKYSSIPATHDLGAYAELVTGVPVGPFRFDIQAGVRATTMLNLPSDYALRGKVYADPRVNLGLTMPKFDIAGRSMIVRFLGGVGQHTKTPTLDYLYPDKAYLDIVEMNFWHENRNYRRIYLQTYVIDPTNTALHAARNTKWEVSMDANWWGNRLNVTYFREDMKSGFRSMAIYAPYRYKVYDTSGINSSALTAPPNPSDLPYTDETDLRGYSRTSNGSRTLKRGVELTFSSRRVPVINTRLTVTGAWFKTEYRNSQDIMERPSTVLGGKQINLVGIYRDDDGYIREMYNTNFTFDTDIPKLRLGISLSAQCVWLTASQNMEKDNMPVSYMDSDGKIHPFTEADATDTELKFLVRTNTASMFERQTVPFSMNLNLKATKKLMGDRLMVALFVNKLWDAHPDYVRNNFKIRRYVTPYFGLELNMKF